MRQETKERIGELFIEGMEFIETLVKAFLKIAFIVSAAHFIWKFW